MYGLVLLVMAVSSGVVEGVWFFEHSYAMLDPSQRPEIEKLSIPGPTDREKETSSINEHMDQTDFQNDTDIQVVNANEGSESAIHPALIEIVNQDRYLRNFGLARQRVLGDGNCLFRAISQVLVGNEESFADMRFTAAEYMRSHLESFRSFFLSNTNQNTDQQILHEIDTLSQNGVYAGQESVVALSHALGVNILVTYGGTIADPRVFTMQHFSADQSDITLHIVFSNLAGGHYDAVIDHQNVHSVPDITDEFPNEIPQQPSTNNREIRWNESQFSKLHSFSGAVDECQAENIDTKTFACDRCKKSFCEKSELQRHHSQCLPFQGRSKYVSCMVPSCTLKFRTVKLFLDHLESFHGATIEKTTKTFANLQEFLIWKENEEISNNVFFSKERSEKYSKNKVYSQYICNRNGVKRCHMKNVKTTSRHRRGNVKGTCKINSLCPSRMYVSANKTSGEVSVNYIQTHNHSVAFDQTKYLPMPKHLRESISQKLSLGIPVDVILDDIQHNVGNLASRSTDNLQYFHLVNRQNIYAMKRKIADCKFKKNEKDEISTLMWVKELQSDPSVDPVLLFKQHGIRDKSMPLLLKEDFMLALMTNEQTELYKKFGGRVLCMDSTHKTNQYDFKLITLLVIDEYHKGYPIAFCISNREDTSALQYFFKSVQSRSPNTKVNILLTDDDLAAIGAAKAVFGQEISHHLCVWHVLQTWRRKIQSMVANKDHKVEIFFFLHALLNAKTENEFKLYLDKFRLKYSTIESSFFKYFQVNYLSRTEKWALHLRPKDLQTEITTNMFIESFHNKLKTIYFDRKQNKRLDKLISVLLDMEKHYYLHRIKYTSYNKPEDFNLPYISACHSASKDIQNNQICQRDENHYTITSSAANVSPYTVTRLSDSCALESCFQKCKSFPCIDLCGHMYTCSCASVHSMCKHIHKIHGINPERNAIPSDSKSEMVNTKCVNQDLQRNKNQKLMLKYQQAITTITSQLDDPNIRSKRLETIISDLEKIITSNEAVKSITPVNKLEPKFKVSGNQNFETQPRFRSTQKPRKRESTKLKAPSRDEKEKLLSQNLPESNEISRARPRVAPYPPISLARSSPVVQPAASASANPLISDDGGISIHQNFRIPPNLINRPLTVKLPSGQKMTIVTVKPHDNSKTE